MEMTINSSSVDFTKELGFNFAKVLKCGDTIVLSGDLGARKNYVCFWFFKFLRKRKRS